MKKSLSLFAIAILFITGNQSLSAQEETVAGKQFFVEFGGPGYIMSANMDSRFKSNARLGFGFRLGAGFGVGKFDDKPLLDMYGNTIGYESVTRTVYTFPAGLNYILGKPNTSSTFEVGAGVSVLSRKMSLYNLGVEKDGNVIGYFTFMYRVTPVNGGMSFRVGFTPIIGTAGDLFPMGAIGFGYAF
jgi:hypothetical protein